jgi:hypothetical protein
MLTSWWSECRASPFISINIGNKLPQ